jgi:hypothetical protein
MMTKQVLHNQSLIDFVLNHCGCVDSLVEVAIANEISPTKDLIAGELLIIPDNVVVDSIIRDYYYENKIIPAFSITDNNRDKQAFAYEFAIEF